MNININSKNYEKKLLFFVVRYATKETLIHLIESSKDRDVTVEEIFRVGGVYKRVSKSGNSEVIIDPPTPEPPSVNDESLNGCHEYYMKNSKVFAALSSEFKEKYGIEIDFFKSILKHSPEVLALPSDLVVKNLTYLKEYDIPLIGYKEIEGKRKPELYNIDLNDLKIGDIRFDIIIFEKDNIIYNYVNTEKSTINDYLRENGGIRVYRDNVRVYDYGERDNDWLGIDLKRVHRVGGNISNNIILGSVRLDRKYSIGLKEKTNREGFIEDEAYFAFRDAIDHVLSIIVRFRNEDKERLTTLYKNNKAIEPVLAELSDAISLVEEKVTNKTANK